MRQHSDQFDRYHVACLAVTFETQQQAQRYVDEFELDWPMLVDVERTIYRAFDLDPRASMWNLIRPTFWPRYLSLMLRGRRVRKPTGDIYQLGGNVLVDPDGIVRLHRGSTNPLDRPSPEQILRVVQGNKNSSSATE